MQFASVSLSAPTIKYSQPTAPTATIVVADTSYGTHIYVSDGTDALMHVWHRIVDECTADGNE